MVAGAWLLAALPAIGLQAFVVVAAVILRLRTRRQNVIVSRRLPGRSGFGAVRGSGPPDLRLLEQFLSSGHGLRLEVQELSEDLW